MKTKLGSIVLSALFKFLEPIGNKLRWWESKPRYEVSLKCRIRTQAKESVKAKVADLSEGGVLLQLKPKKTLGKGELIELRFHHGDRLIFIKAKVVYQGEEGRFGVQFEHDRASLSFIQSVVAEIKSTGVLARSQLPLSEDIKLWSQRLLSDDTQAATNDAEEETETKKAA